MVPAEKRNPLNTSTYGTGELIKDALDRGYRKISIAIGGSATNDGGMGAMRALGVRFLDAQGHELEGKGEDLTKVADIDVGGLHQGSVDHKPAVCPVQGRDDRVNGSLPPISHRYPGCLTARKDTSGGFLQQGRDAFR